MHQRVMLSELTGLWMYIRAVRFIDRGSHRRAIVNVATVEVSIGLPLGGAVVNGVRVYIPPALRH
jgi:hypothetical protein